MYLIRDSKCQCREHQIDPDDGAPEAEAQDRGGRPPKCLQAAWRPSVLPQETQSAARGKSHGDGFAAGTASWTTRKGRVLRAYRSTIDGSIQPYGMIIPESYTGQPFRLDIWMHGTNRNLNEVLFIKQHELIAYIKENTAGCFMPMRTVPYPPME